MFGEHHHHHRSLFPLVIILLSAGLIVLMYFSFTDSSSTKIETNVQETTQVSSEDYKVGLTSTINKFLEDRSSAEDDLQRLLSAEQALNSLLSMKVPAEYQGLHLELALSLNMMQSGLRSEDHEDSEGFERFNKTVSRLSAE